MLGFYLEHGNIRLCVFRYLDNLIQTRRRYAQKWGSSQRPQIAIIIYETAIIINLCTATGETPQ